MKLLSKVKEFFSFTPSRSKDEMMDNALEPLYTMYAVIDILIENSITDWDEIDQKRIAQIAKFDQIRAEQKEDGLNNG